MRSKRVQPDHRFLAPHLVGAGDDVVLGPDEGRHLTQVLRLRQGDYVSVFDGSGREFLAEVSSTARSGVTVTLIRPVEPAPEALIPFSIVQGILKGSAMDDAVRDAAMIGAAAIHPVVSSHVAVKGSIISKEETLDRWRRISLASTKQCRRAVVPAVHQPCGLLQWLESAEQELKLILVEPAIVAEVVSFRTLMSRPPPASAALIIGPEGGWSREEIAVALARGCVAVTLGPLTLRADAVPLAAGCLFRFLWEGNRTEPQPTRRR